MKSRSTFEDIIKCDPEIAALTEEETAREENTLEMIASENFASDAVRAACGTILTNKYAEGVPGHRYYGGCYVVDKIESLARERACKLFGAEHANVQPHSGSQANFAAYRAMGVANGDTVLSLQLSEGAHLTHGSPVNFSGKSFNMVFYGLGADGRIDMHDVEKKALECKPKLIVAGTSAYSRVIDYKEFRRIADEVGAKLMVDMAHIAGLVAAGLHMSPVPYADVVTSTTHKTLRGPRGGLILTNNFQLYKKLNSAVFPGTQGGPLEHIIAAKAAAFGEALKPEFKEYQQQIIKNAAALAEALKEEGMDLVSGGTDNHLMLLDFRKQGVTGKEMETRLDEVYITVNKNMIPQDPQPANLTSGIRIGTPAVTTRGFKEPEMKKIAEFIHLAATDFDNKADYIRHEVEELCKNFPLYQ